MNKWRKKKKKIFKRPETTEPPSKTKTRIQFTKILLGTSGPPM
jgi:hypothetical protein